MVTQVCKMLRDNQNLIREFRKFLPEENVATEKTELSVSSGEVDAQSVLFIVLISLDMQKSL